MKSISRHPITDHETVLKNKDANKESDVILNIPHAKLNAAKKETQKLISNEMKKDSKEINHNHLSKLHDHMNKLNRMIKFKEINNLKD